MGSYPIAPTTYLQLIQIRVYNQLSHGGLMRIITAIPKVLKPWSKRVKCGPLENGPPVEGCGSEVEVTGSDIFHRTVQTSEMTGRSFHWRCPICNVTNFISFNDVPTHECQSNLDYLLHLRKETMIDIAKLYPIEERLGIIETLGNEHLLDDDLMEVILKTETLFQ